MTGLVSERFPVRFAERHPTGYVVVAVVVVDEEGAKLHRLRWTCEQMWEHICACFGSGHEAVGEQLLRYYGFARRPRSEFPS